MNELKLPLTMDFETYNEILLDFCEAFPQEVNKFNGFKFINRLEAEGESILISAKVSNCTLAYSIIENQSEFNTNGNGLIKITGNAGQEVSNIIIQNFKVEKGSKRPTLIYGYGINNFTIKDSMFLGSNDSDLYTDAVKLGSSGNYGVKGTITITGNTFKDYGQYLIWIQKCDTAVINVSSNLFINNGQKSDTHGALRIASASSTFTEVSITMENNIINNSYMLFRVDNVAAFTASKFKAELHNNSILNSKANVHIKNESAGTINATNNYYDVTPTKEKFIGVSTWDPYLKEDPNK